MPLPVSLSRRDIPSAVPATKTVIRRVFRPFFPSGSAPAVLYRVHLPHIEDITPVYSASVRDRCTPPPMRMRGANRIRHMSHILVIEDDADIAALIAHYLEKAGHHVDRLTSGSDVLPRLRKSPSDLVI